MKRNPATGHWLAAVCLVFVDQFLKIFARNHPEAIFYLWEPWLGWEYFSNTGIAFSLPFPYWLTLALTPCILILIWRFRHRISSTGMDLGLKLLFSGAISNYFDRILFQETTDYLRIATGVLNLADLLIIFGLFLLVFQHKQGYRMVHNTPKRDLL